MLSIETYGQVALAAPLEMNIDNLVIDLLHLRFLLLSQPDLLEKVQVHSWCLRLPLGSRCRIAYLHDLSFELDK